MLAIGAIGLNRRAVKVKCLLASLIVLFIIPGCGTQWFPKTIEADPDAISEVRGIGRKVAQTTTELVSENTTQKIDVLILDFGASDFINALSIAHDRLRQRGWVVTGRANDVINMKSKKWGQTSVVMKSLGSLQDYGVAQELQISKTLKSDRIESSAYVVLAITPYA